MSEGDDSRLIDVARRETLLYRILSGKLDYKNSYIREPSLRIKEKGSRIFYEILNACKDVPTDQEICRFLIITNQWSFEQEKKFNNLPKEIDNSKVEYFQNYDNPALKRYKKIELDTKKQMYKEMYSQRHKYKNYTAEGIANGAMWFEMIGCMYDGTDKLDAVAYYHQNSISEDDIRYIAQSDSWLSYYSCSRNVFGRPVKMSDDQRRLIIWANIYRNTKTSSDCPHDGVFKDHDAFDGYLIHEQRKSKAQKKVENIKGINPNASNVYMFAKNDEDYHTINSLNSPDALRKIENEFRQQKVVQ